MKRHFILSLLQISLVSALPRPNAERLHPAIFQFRQGFDGLDLGVLIVNPDALALELPDGQGGNPTSTTFFAAVTPNSETTSQLPEETSPASTSPTPAGVPSSPAIPSLVFTSVSAAKEAPQAPPTVDQAPTPTSIPVGNGPSVVVTSVQIVTSVPTPLPAYNSIPIHSTSTPLPPPPPPPRPATNKHKSSAVETTSVPVPPAPPATTVDEETQTPVAAQTSAVVEPSPVPPPPAVTTSTSTSTKVQNTPSPDTMPPVPPVSLPSVESTPAAPAPIETPSVAPTETTSLTLTSSTIATSSTSVNTPSSPETERQRTRLQPQRLTKAEPRPTTVLPPQAPPVTTSSSAESTTPASSTGSAESSSSTSSTSPLESQTVTTATEPHNTRQSTKTKQETRTHERQTTEDRTRHHQPNDKHTTHKSTHRANTVAAQTTRERQTRKPEAPKAHHPHTRTWVNGPGETTLLTVTTEIILSTTMRTTTLLKADRHQKSASPTERVITDVITVTVTRWVPCPTGEDPPTRHRTTGTLAPPQTLTTKDRQRPTGNGNGNGPQGQGTRKNTGTRRLNTGRPTRTKPNPTRQTTLPRTSTNGEKLPARPTSQPPMVSVAPSVTVTLETTLTTSEVQTVTVSTTVTAETEGTVHTTLRSATTGPFRSTVIPTNRATTIKPITTGTNKITTLKTSATAPMSGNIFAPFATGAPPSQITKRGNHPVPPLGIVNQSEPLQTNKFYANFFLGTRTQGTWTHPYSVSWSKGGGAAGSWGIAVSHIERSQLVYGGSNPLGQGDPPEYFINPIGIQSIILSARELGSSTDLTMDSLAAFSANVNLAAAPGGRTLVTFPLVQGMGFVTGVYDQATPFLQSGVFFSNMTFAGKVAGGASRYDVALNDGTNWLIYVQPRTGSTAPTLTLASSSMIVGNGLFSGTIQVAKIPQGSNAQPIYDQAAGAYPIRGGIAATVSKATGQYTISWTKGGDQTKKLLMFALPHHMQTLSSTTAAGRTAIQLVTTTKGLATAISADSWTLVENDLPFDMGFAPWSPSLRSQTHLPASVVQLMNQVATSELSENFTAQTDLNSMYFSGKGLAKFAMIVYATSNLANNKSLASAGLVKLKQSFARFTSNTQIYPLVYDTTWGGVVSVAGYSDPGADFGNTYYNDHHFHYGYFVYTAAVIGALDPSWLREGTNKAWVNTLLRDYANSVKDGYFPFSRMFDWYHGHSWAHGIIESGDGKDQESSSEDAFASYALKMWGRTIGDANMEARGNLMLAVQARSLGNYYLLKSDNLVEPSNFIGNKAAGIIFENKIDHTTYFGTNIEYIEGIHMLPLNPSSTLTRSKAFVQQEWDTYFSNGRVDSVAGGWRGILYANLAIIDPKTAYNFFANPSFNNEYLDGGASRTWYLAFCAGLGGAS